MKKVIFLATGIFFIALTAFKATTPSAGTYEGTLVDTKCYSLMPKMNAGNDHQIMGADGKLMEVRGCATACANMGIPVGLLDKKGNLHVLAAPAGQIAPYMAKEAKVTGKETNGVVVIDKLEVKEGDSWKEVKLVYMMK